MNSGKRVATIWSTYGDYHVARLKALTEHGFEVIPFAHCERDPAYPFFLTKPESLVVVNRGASDRINPVLSLWRTWRLLRIHRPDIVLTTGYERTESLAAWLYAQSSSGKGGARPIVILMLNNRAEDHPRNRLVELVKSVYLRVFDGFLTSGSGSRDYLKQLGVPHSKIELGYNCVDNDQMATLVAKYRATRQNANSQDRYFLCIARLVAKKNIPGVLRAYHSYLRWLPDSESPTSLVICGDGPDRSAIEDLIRQLGLESLVSLVGEVQGIDAVAEQLANCKAFLLASTSDETWGLVVNEAMAAGSPVLVSVQSGCARDLVEPSVNGFTFDGQDSEALARHMLWLQTHQRQLEAMGKKSKEIISRFTPARFAESASNLAASAARSTPRSVPVSGIRPPDAVREPPMNSGTRVATIWSTYGDYHVARLKALTEHGFEVIPFAHCERDPAYPFFLTKPESLVVVNRGASDRINPVLSMWRTWRLLRIHRPDIVLTAGYERTESLAACLYAQTSSGKRGGRPVVILMGENRAEDHPRRWLRDRVKSVYLKAFDGFVTSGSASRDYLKQLGVPTSRIELGYSCVDNDQIATLVSQHRGASQDASPKGRYFLCIARLVAKKNIPGLLHAYHSYLRWLPDSEAPTSLVICGDGPERGGIEELIEQLGLGDSVSLVGQVQGIEAIAGQLAKCKALVLASTSDETWGLVVNEAMAAGCPVLVSRQCGCARDLVEPDVNGFTFDGQDSDALARHMLWIHLHVDRLEPMGRKSKEIVDRFSPARFAVSVFTLVRSAGESSTTRFPIA